MDNANCSTSDAPPDAPPAFVIDCRTFGKSLWIDVEWRTFVAAQDIAVNIVAAVDHSFWGKSTQPEKQKAASEMMRLFVERLKLKLPVVPIASSCLCSFARRLLSLMFQQETLADTNRLRRDFHQFVVVDKFDGGFQRHLDWGHQRDCFVGT